MPNNKQNDESAVELADDNFNRKAAVFLATVSGISALIGFAATLSAAKKSDPKYFDRGLTMAIHGNRMEMAGGGGGARLALRALAWGTVYSTTGCGLLFYVVWKLSGAKDFAQFRQKIGDMLPKVPKNDPPRSRTEFTGLNDLLLYVSRSKND